ncbi:MAG TPA: hypothetical protein VGV38_13935, partial [Pyrinomonadaceae bacterium]|nr:hypothetical protein [Pyrinomonadaceae bacterium]
MTRRFRLITLLTLIHLVGLNTMAQNGNPPNTPPAAPSPRKAAKTSTLHGETWSDDYFWLREKTNPEVVSYLQAENAYAEAYMKPTEALQAKLYKEMLSRIKETDTNVPYREGEYLYYTRTEQGKQYPIFARRKGTMSAP